MVKKTVLKVNINCPKCKKKLLKTVSSLQGVDKIEADEGKGTLTVTGDADPYEVILRIRKAGKHAEVVSIGPPPAPPKEDTQKKPEEKKPEENKKPEDNKKPEEKKKPDPAVQFDPICQLPYPYGPCPYYMPPNYCPGYQPIALVYEPNPSCSIM